MGGMNREVHEGTAQRALDALQPPPPPLLPLPPPLPPPPGGCSRAGPRPPSRLRPLAAMDAAALAQFEARAAQAEQRLAALESKLAAGASAPRGLPLCCVRLARSMLRPPARLPACARRKPSLPYSPRAAAACPAPTCAGGGGGGGGVDASRYVAELQALKGVLLAAKAEQEGLEKRVAEVRYSENGRSSKELVGRPERAAGRRQARGLRWRARPGAHAAPFPNCPPASLLPAPGFSWRPRSARVPALMPRPPVLVGFDSLIDVFCLNPPPPTPPLAHHSWRPRTASSSTSACT